MAQTPEGKIKALVTKELKALGIWYFFPGNNGFGKSGIPDIIAIVDGRFVGIECKSDPSKQPTALQVKCGEEIKAAGGSWILVRCKDDVNLVNKLKQADR